MRVLSAKFSRLTFTLITTLMGVAHAQVVSFKDVQAGATFAADRVDMGFGPMVPIPKGEWRVLKRNDFADTVFDKNMVHVTLLNADKTSALKFFTFTTFAEWYFNVPSQPQWMCPTVPGVPGTVAQSYGVSNSSFSYACSYFQQYEKFDELLSYVEKTNAREDVDSFGYVNGMVRPYLADPAAIAELGAKPLLWRMEVSRRGERQIFYTAGVKMDRRISVKDASDADVAAIGAWFQGFGKESLNAVEGVKFEARRFDVRISASVANVEEAQSSVRFDDVDSLPSTDPKIKDFYKKFIDSKIASNRTFVINGKGTAAGWSSGSWPFNERNAYMAARKPAAGKQSELFFYSINDRVVWDPANQGK